MSLSVNGSPAPLPSPATVAGLVAALPGAGPRGIAIAVNGEVVPRSAWDATGLHPGDRVLCIAFGSGSTWGGLALQWNAPATRVGLIWHTFCSM